MNNFNGQEYYGIRLDVDNLKKDVAQIKGQFQSIGKTVDVESSRMLGMFGKIGAGVAGAFTISKLTAFTTEIARVRGEFQQLEIAFETMLGSKEKSDKLMSQLIRTAAVTPFGMKDVTQGAKQLLAYGIEAEKVNHTLVKLGDIAAGLSVPLGDLVYLYGTTMTQGRMFTMDLRQFMGRGIPLAEELAKQFNVAKSEVEGLVSTGKVGAEEFHKAIMSMADGKFLNLMEKQSASITGQIANLEDAIEVMKNEMGKEMEDVFSGAIESATWLVENYEKIGKEILGLVTAYGAYKAVMITLNAIERKRRVILVMINKLAKEYMLTNKAVTKAEAVRIVQTNLLTKALIRQTAVQTKANLVAMANPYVLAAAAVAGLAYGIYKLVTTETALEKATKSVNAEMERQKQALEDGKSKTEELIRTAQDLEKTDTQRRTALNELQKLYPDLFSNLDLESVKYIDLAEYIRQVNLQLERKSELDLEQKIAKGEEILKKIPKVGTIGMDVAKEALELMGEKSGWWQQGWFGADKAEQFENFVNGLKDKLSEIKRIKKQAEFDAQSTELKIKHYQDQNKELEKQKKLIEENHSNTREGYLDQQAELDKINTQIRKNNASIEALQKKPTKPTDDDKNKKDYTDQLAREIQELERQLVDFEHQAEQSQIDAKDEGLAKILAQNELNFKKEKEQLKRQAEDRLKAIQDHEKTIFESKRKKGKKDEEGKFTPKTTSLSKDELEQYDKLEQDARAKANQENAKAKIQYELEFERIHSQVTATISNSEKARHDEIKRNYADLRKEIEKLYKGGSITKEQYDNILPEIDVAENKEQLQQILSGVYDYQSQLDEINETWNAKLQADAELNGGKLAEAIKKGKEKAISELASNELMSSESWQNLFGNLDELTAQQITTLLNEIDTNFKSLSGKFSPVDLKEIRKKLNEAKSILIQDNPFKQVGESLKAIFSNAGSDSKDSAENIKKNWNDLAQSTEKSFEFVVDAVNSAEFLKDAIGDVGATAISSMATVVSVAVAVSAAIKTAEKSSVILVIIQAALVVIQAVLNVVKSIIAQHDKKLEKTIKKNEEALADLDRAYSKLESTVNDVYASDRVQHIEQMKRMKEKQKELIRANIEAEKSKKNPDKSKIKEWENQISDLDDEIEKLGETAKEAIMGKSVQDAINEFAEAYVSAWGAGEDKAKSMKDVVKGMIRSVIKQLTSKELAGAVKFLYDTINKALADGMIDDYEAWLIENAENYLYQRAENLDKQYEKAGLNKYKDKASQGAASYGAYEKITSEQADELTGIQRGMHLSLVNIDSRLVGISEHTKDIPVIRTDIFEMKNALTDIWGEAVLIRKNTALIVDTNDKLDKIIKNTDKL